MYLSFVQQSSLFTEYTLYVVHYEHIVQYCVKVKSVGMALFEQKQVVLETNGLLCTMTFAGHKDKQYMGISMFNNHFLRLTVGSSSNSSLSSLTGAYSFPPCPSTACPSSDL